MDVTAASRLLDELRGGNRGFAGERRLAERITAACPAAPRMIRFCDSWHAWAAQKAAHAGARAVIFGGAGLPSRGDPLHRGAVNAGAWCGYPHPDDVAVTLRAQSFMGEVGALASFAGSLLRPAALLEAAAEAGMPPGPVHLQWGMASWLTDAARAACMADAYRHALPRGSTIAIAAAESTPDPGREAGLLSHSAEDVRAWAKGAGLEFDGPADYAVEDVRVQGRPWVRRRLCRVRGPRIVGAVARVP